MTTTQSLTGTKDNHDGNINNNDDDNNNNRKANHKNTPTTKSTHSNGGK